MRSESKAQRCEVQLRGYRHEGRVRADIRHGDVLLFRGTELLSRMIEIGTGSCYSHAALVFRTGPEVPFRTPWEHDRVCLIEAVRTGVRVRLLSEELLEYPGAVELWRVRPVLYHLFKPHRAIAETRAFEGLKYAYDCLPAFMLKLLRASVTWQPDDHKPREFFCSQLVSYGLRAAGIDPNPRLVDAATSPGDLVRAKRLRFVYAFAQAEVVDELKARESMLPSVDGARMLERNAP